MTIIIYKFLSHYNVKIFYICTQLANRLKIRKHATENALHTPKPMSSTDDCATTYGIVLIGNPHYENNVECSGCVIEEFRHNRFHSLTQSHKHKYMHNYSHVKFILKND